jgi:tRNA(Ile)-lysidine synthase
MDALPLAERLRLHLTASRLFPEAGRAVLAVSGGGDSMAMLDLMAGLAPGLGLTLMVAHADHGITAGSGAIAARVRAEAGSRYGIAAEIGTLRLGAGASETRSRHARYRFLRAVQATHGARYLLTAHHADDQAETVLLRVLRGSAPAGLAAIAASGPRGLVRPLLPFRHVELVAHARAAGLEVSEDPANADPRHLRSWVRTALLPVLEERLGGQAASGLLELARHARGEIEAWDAVLDVLPGLALRLSDGRFEVARAALRGYDNTLAGRILRAAARRAGARLSPDAASRVAALGRAAASGRRLDLGAGLEAEAAFDVLIVGPTGSAPGTVPLDCARGEAAFGPYRLAWRSEPAPARFRRDGWTTWLPVGAWVVRAPRPGDSVAPLGGVGRRKVARLLMEARVPRSGRWSYPVVADEEGVVWIPGVCRAAARLPEPGGEAVRIDARAG